MQKITLLAVSGSLKSTSSNSAILEALRGLSPAGVQIGITDLHGRLPLFNPDQEEGDEMVKEFRKQVAACDGVVICTPEYAFGLPGGLKNALDWLVSSGELNDKPVAAISASPLNTGGEHALNALTLTLKALGTKTHSKMTLKIPNVYKKMSGGKITDEATEEQLRFLLRELTDLIRN
jgi:NAD(P)H-dependent FMN reductase